MERCVGRHSVRQRAHDQAREQPDETGADVHVTRFSDDGPLPSEPLRSAVSRSLVQGKPSLDLGWTRRPSGLL